MAEAVAVAVAGGGVLVTTMIIGSGVGTASRTPQLTHRLSDRSVNKNLADIALLATISDSLTYVVTFVESLLQTRRPHRLPYVRNTSFGGNGVDIHQSEHARMRRRGDGARCAVCRAQRFRRLVYRMSARTPGRLVTSVAAIPFLHRRGKAHYNNEKKLQRLP